MVVVVGGCGWTLDVVGGFCSWMLLLVVVVVVGVGGGGGGGGGGGFVGSCCLWLVDVVGGCFIGRCCWWLFCW